MGVPNRQLSSFMDKTLTYVPEAHIFFDIRHGGGTRPTGRITKAIRQVPRPASHQDQAPDRPFSHYARNQDTDV